MTERHATVPWRLLLFSLCAAAAAAAVAADPLQWPPTADPPEFRAVLDDKTFQTHLAAALRKIDKEKLARLQREANAVMIKRVREKSPAESLGIRPGLVVLELAGEKISCLADFNHLLAEASGKQLLILEDKEGKRMEVMLPPGQMGMMLQEDYMPDLAYWRGAKRSAKWDDLVLVALANHTVNPDLAETAWQRALATGYERDALADYSGMQAAYAQLRFAEAFAFGESALRRQPEPPLMIEVVLTMVDAARVAAKPRSALSIMPKAGPWINPQEIEKQMRSLIARYEALPEDLRGLSSVDELAAKARRVDILQRLKSFPKGEDFFAALQKGKNVKFSMPPGYGDYCYADLPAGVKSFDLELVYQVRFLTAEQQLRLFFLVGVGDSEAIGAEWLKTPDAGGLLAFQHKPGWAQVCEAHRPYMVSTIYAPFSCPSDRSHTVRLLRFAQHHEVIVDGKRAFWSVQAYEPGDLFFFIKYGGVEVHIESLRFEALE
ncbi:MAG: PDZ domain-containing protein [Planctomycetota bacterium]|nr:PDZ domain-containing protein [Planctomycetota bacterium]